MGATWSDNIYIDLDSLKELQDKYNNAIKRFTDLYFDFEAEIKKIEEENAWQGKSYEEFKEKFNQWKISYLQKLSEIVQLKDFIEDVSTVGELFIEQRDKLKDSLNV